MDALTRDELAEALVGDVDPEQLEPFRFAVGIMPVFRLVRTLFSQSELDTCLKLMLLHEVSRAGGRSSLERIRSLVSFLDPQRVDALVRSLREGGWLDLRATDNTYVPSMTGMSLLALLSGADLGSVTPSNVMARAAQTAEFNSRLDGARAVVGYLLDQLYVLLDGEVDQARQILMYGRPAQMISWSRRQHTRQLETIHGVLSRLEDQLDQASREFARVVRLHETMQELVRMHTSIHTRLRDWNLERLYTSETGYSIPQLVEAVLGVDDETLERGWSPDLLQLPTLPPALGFDEIRARFHGARRKVASQHEVFSYSAPAEPDEGEWQPSDHDPVTELRATLTALFANRGPADPPLTLESWLDTPDFTTATWLQGVLSRLHEGEAQFKLDDGRTVTLKLESLNPAGVPPADLLGWLENNGALCDLPSGLLTQIDMRVQEESPQ